MAQSFDVPFIPSTPQSFSISLSNVVYRITAKWNRMSKLWAIDVADSDGNMLIAGYPLITGADLLEQFKYMGFVGRIYAQSDSDPTAPPTFDDLGVTGHVFYVTGT